MKLGRIIIFVLLILLVTPIVVNAQGDYWCRNNENGHSVITARDMSTSGATLHYCWGELIYQGQPQGIEDQLWITYPDDNKMVVLNTGVGFQHLEVSGNGLVVIGISLQVDDVPSELFIWDIETSTLPLVTPLDLILGLPMLNDSGTAFYSVPFGRRSLYKWQVNDFDLHAYVEIMSLEKVLNEPHEIVTNLYKAAQSNVFALQTTHGSFAVMDEYGMVFYKDPLFTSEVVISDDGKVFGFIEEFGDKLGIVEIYAPEYIGGYVSDETPTSIALSPSNDFFYVGTLEGNIWQASFEEPFMLLSCYQRESLGKVMRLSATDGEVFYMTWTETNALPVATFGDCSTLA